MNDAQRMKRVEKAQLKVLFHVPFFAPGVARLPVEFIDDPTIETACTDGRKIYWDRTWFDTLDDQVLVTVLCHEVGHPMLGHLWRFPAGGDLDVWNQATDHAINTMLTEFGQMRVNAGFADPFPMPDLKGICNNPKYTGRAEEAIYAELMANRPPGGGKSPRSGSGGIGGQGQSKGSRAGQGKGKAVANSTSQGSGGGIGQFRIPVGTPQQQKQLETDWKHTLIQSVASSKGRGDVPGSMARYVDEMLHPKVPWIELVRNWLREKAEDDWNWSKPNPYFDDSGFILPSLDSERIGAAFFAKDTSGSIDGRILAQFQTEEQSFLDDMRPAKLVDLCCDTRITSEKEYRVGDTIDRNCPGGGGTSFVPVFNRLEEMPEKPKLLVYLTDLDGAFPDKHPDYPVLWIVFGDGEKKAPFGDVIEVK